MKIGEYHAAVHPFGLIDRNPHRPLGAAKLVGDFLVERGDADTPVDHEDDRISFGDSLLGLTRHLVHDAVLGQRLETAGIDHQIRLGPQLAVTVMTIASQAGNIGDQRVTRAGQPVEKGRFTDIRPADDDNGGLHSVSIA